MPNNIKLNAIMMILKQQVPFLCSRPVVSWCFNIEQINPFYLVLLHKTYKCI